ncbi:oxidoreductase [Mycena belliarum]|uniref:Oxidoreductase n=1 Tax=Mycena belliarum TaxID=1033014 RepID=A0AAD6UH91_9AGAR|nr:oxidoreductase [Mycena belliae]
MSRVVLVTGCSAGGIGYSLHGCRVYATARRLEAMAGLDAHPRITLQTLDVTSDADVRRVVEAVVAEAGQIDIVVNNAGVLGIGAEQPMETVKATFDANTYGALRVAQAAFPHMATRRSGLVVNIGSVVGDIAVPWNGLYSATKAAMHSMSDILSMEFKPFGLRVMNVAPASIRSNIASNEAVRFSLPEGSRYQAFLPNMIQRMQLSQGAGAMPTAACAKEIVRRALQANPPHSLVLGGKAYVFKILQWLPKAWVLWYAWRLYSRRP